MTQEEFLEEWDMMQDIQAEELYQQFTKATGHNFTSKLIENRVYAYVGPCAVCGETYDVHED